MVTHNPLHRSGRAALPHPAPTLGRDGQSLIRVRVVDAERGQVGAHHASRPIERQTTRGLTAATQSAPPQPDHAWTKGAELRAVHRHARVFDRAGSKRISRSRRASCCLPRSFSASAPRWGRCLRSGSCLSHLNGSPVHPSVNASPPPSRASAHDSKSVWFATPSL